MDQAVEHGLTASSHDRKTEASLLSHAADLDQLLTDRYPDEHLADEFHDRYRDERMALRRKARGQLTRDDGIPSAAGPCVAELSRI